MALTTPLSHLNRDGKILVAASSLRAVGQGFMSVTLAVFLAKWPSSPSASDGASASLPSPC